MYAAAYSDDVIIHSGGWAEHMQQVAAVLKSLAGLTANRKKCAVGRRYVSGVQLGWQAGASPGR